MGGEFYSRKTEYEGLLTDVEFLGSLKTKASNKIQGTEGLLAEFHKVFFLRSRKALFIKCPQL